MTIRLSLQRWKYARTSYGKLTQLQEHRMGSSYAGELLSVSFVAEKKEEDTHVMQFRHISRAIQPHVYVC